MTNILVLALSFTGNFGNESLLFAGLEKVGAVKVNSIDVDLSKTVGLIPLKIEK